MNTSSKLREQGIQQAARAFSCEVTELRKALGSTVRIRKLAREAADTGRQLAKLEGHSIAGTTWTARADFLDTLAQSLETLDTGIGVR